jgi:hypothetical protein
MSIGQRRDVAIRCRKDIVVFATSRRRDVKTRSIFNAQNRWQAKERFA